MKTMLPSVFITICAITVIAIVWRNEKACERRECEPGATAVYLGKKCVCLPEARSDEP